MFLRGALAKASKVVAGLVMRPSVLGAAYLLGLTASNLSRNVDDDPALGEHAQEIRAFVERGFGQDVTHTVLALAGAAVAIGAALGFLASLIVRARRSLAAQPVPGMARLALSSLAVMALLHAWIEGLAMAAAPQLYAHAFYARGGFHRAVQLVVTDYLGRGGLLVVGAIALLVYLAGPPSTWRDWPTRLRRAAPPLPVVALLSAATMLTPLLATHRHGLAPASMRVAGRDAPSQPNELGGEGSDARPNVIVLAVDSLRADHLTPRFMPNLSALAREGTSFERAYVSLPRTFPSWVTLLTGRHPHHHGIRSMFPRWEDRARDFDALPARLRRAGYQTAVVSDYAGDIFRRIDLGFADIDAPTSDFHELVRERVLDGATSLMPFLHTQLGRRAFPVLREFNDAADPEMLADDAIRALGRVSGKPWFMVVFFSAAHFPYAAPAPDYRRFTDPSYAGRFKYYKPVGLGQEAPVTDADVAQIRGLYEGALYSIDRASQRVLAAVERSGQSDRTAVVVLADHGESLYENGRGQGHGDHLFGDETTHIPLVVRDPRHRGERRAPAVVRDVDLAPTIYELTGVAPPEDLDGRSLVPALDGNPLAPAHAYAETELWFTHDVAGVPRDLRFFYPPITQLLEVDHAHGDEIVLQAAIEPLVVVAKHRMVRDERFKLVYAPVRSGARYLLFDTEVDPGETKDIAAERPEIVARLREELWSWAARDPRMMERGGLLVPRKVDTSLETSTGTDTRIGAP